MIDILKEAAEIARHQKEIQNGIATRENESLVQAQAAKEVLWKAALEILQQIDGKVCAYGKFVLRKYETGDRMGVWAHDPKRNMNLDVLTARADISTGAACDEEDYSYPVITMVVYPPNHDGEEGGAAIGVRHGGEMPALQIFLAKHLAQWMAGP